MGLEEVFFEWESESSKLFSKNLNIEKYVII